MPFGCIGHSYRFNERTQHSVHSLYGCSKGVTDHYMQDSARKFGLKTVVFLHSSRSGIRQFTT